jgi:glycosyltransferase involved in cell wall biosynthesis
MTSMPATKQPLVSIALCTYNGGHFLPAQLDSILNQDYANIEIIVVDDCSDDNTRDVLEWYAHFDKRIKLYYNERNLGYVRNFERAIKLCKGKFIALADQDDIWESDKISIMQGNIGDKILAYHNSDYIDEQNKRIGNDTVATVFRIYDGQSCLPFILSNCVHGHAVLFNKRLKKYLFPFNEKFSHDWWIAYVAFNVGSVKYIDKVLVHYRQHRHSITDTHHLQSQLAEQTEPVRGIRRISLNLELLKYCAEFKYNRNSSLIRKAYQLLSGLAEGHGRIKSFFFLVKYFNLFFYMRYRQRKLPSKMNMVRKICFD